VCCVPSVLCVLCAECAVYYGFDAIFTRMGAGDDIATVCAVCAECNDCIRLNSIEKCIFLGACHCMSMRLVPHSCTSRA
jgi:hypothetical protein